MTAAQQPDREAGPELFDVVVVVGTDHHRFDRLIEWTDAWLTDRPGVRGLIQHGTAHPPKVASGRALVPHGELQQQMRAARVVVCHGGPATITEIRKLGKLPVVVPRDPALGEHVDGHQQRFSRRMAADGFVALCETRADFERAVCAALADPASFVVTPEGEAERVQATVAVYGRILDEVIAQGRRGRVRRR